MATVASTAPARAVDYTWLGTASGLWTNASNWNPGTGTPGAADTAIFNGAGNGNTTIDLSGTASLLGLVFDTSSAAAYTIGSGGVNAQRLQLANSGSVSMTSTVAANQTVNAVLALGTNASAGSYTFQNDDLTNTLTFSGSVLGGTGGTAGAKTLTLAGAGNTTISGVIATGGASSVAVTKSGAGTATLTGANSYAGATTINSGTLQVGNGGTTGSLSTSSAISVSSGAALVFNRSDDYGSGSSQNFGTVSGAGSIVLQTGTLFVTTNSLTGGIVVNGGQLDIGSATPMGAGGRFTINGGTFTARIASRTVANAGTITNDFQVGAVGNGNALTLSGSFDLAGGTRTATAVGAGATFSGNLYNGALTKSGPGTLVLTGSNTYTGTTSVLAGTLQIGSTGTAGSISSSSVLVLGGGGLTLSRSDAATQAFASTTLAPGASSVSASASNTVNFGAITRQAGATLNIAATGTFITSSTNTNGILGAGILYNNTAFAVANGANAITGLATFVNSSTAGNTPANYANANINLDSSPSPTGAITPNSLRTGQGPTLTLANTLNTIQSGGILVVNTNSNPVLITGGTLTGPSGGDLVVMSFKSNALASTVVTINSVIVDNGGPLGFTIGGTGRVALGGVNTYSGTTTINGGILIARNTSAFGTGPVVVRAAATLGTQVTGTIANAIQLNATLTLNPSGSNSTLSGVISGSGLLSIPSGVSGTIAFAGNNTFTGNIQFGTDAAAGGPTVLVATRSTSFGVGTKTVSLSSAIDSYNRTVALDGSGGNFTLGSNISYTLSNDGASGSPAVLNVAGNNTIAGAISMTTGGGGGTLVQSDAGSLTLAGNITSVSNYQALILGGVAGGSVSGVVSDGANTAAITKQGAGTWTLTAANTYTGTTTINAGILQIGNAGAAGSLGGLGAITGSSGAALVFNRTNLVLQGTDFSNGIGGGLLVSQIGTGTLTLSSSNSHTGGTTLSAGQLNINQGNALGTGTFTLGGGALDNTSGAAVTLATNNPQAWNGDFSFVGTRDLNLGTGTVTLSADRQVTTSAGTLTVGGPITGAFGLTKAGAGTLVLGGSSAYSGQTTVSGGLLTLGTSGAISNLSNLLVNGGGFNLAGFSDTVGTITLTSGSIFGTGTLAGTSYALQGGTLGSILGSGPITVSSGTTTLGSAGRFNSASGLTISSGQLTLSGSESVASYSQSGGTLGGSGKVTAATYALGGGTVTANLGSGTVTVTAASTLAGTSDATSLNLNSGTLTLGNGSRFTSATIAVTGSSGGGIALGGNESFGSLAGGANIALGSGTLSVGSAATNTTYFGKISGNGAVLKQGGGLLVLNGTNAYSGGTVITAGTIRAGNSAALGASTGALALNAGALDLYGNTVTVGMLSGSAGSSISSTLGAARLVASSAANSTFAGVIADGAGSVGFTKAGTGKLTFTDAQTYTGSTIISGGTLALASGASLANSTYLKAGAAANDGGVLDVTALGSGLSVGSGQKLGGYGTVLGDVTIAGGAIVAPGGSVGSLTNVGTQTWGPGGRYLFEITNPGGAAGTGWDLLTVGSLSITATTGLNQQFIVDIQTLTNANDQSAGVMGNWDPSTNYQWLFLVANTTTFTAENFDPLWFTINTSSAIFKNDINGTFSVARGDTVAGGNANQLYIVYASVPEPGTFALAAAGLGALGVARWRRRRPARAGAT